MIRKASFAMRFWIHTFLDKPTLAKPEPKAFYREERQAREGVLLFLALFVAFAVTIRDFYSSFWLVRS